MMAKVEIWTIDNGFIAETYDGLTTTTKFFKTWPQALAFVRKFFEKLERDDKGE